MDTISLNLNNQKHVASVFLDVEKAFDRVWHKGLLYKMKMMEIPSGIIKIINSFLQDRTFRVKIEDKLSTSRPVAAGVPQGSVLAPTLYLIFTNDIPTTTTAKISLFADDTMFFAANNNVKYAIIQAQKQIRLASDWFFKWRLRLNASKTVAVMFSRKTHYVNLNQIVLNNTPLAWSKSVKYLGVTIDRRLNFSDHVNNIISKATQIRGILHPIINFNSSIPPKTRLNILKLYVLPILTYAGAAWAPYINRSHWSKIEACQTKGIRHATGLPIYVRKDILLKSTFSKTLQETIKSQSSSFFFKNSLSRHQHIRELRRSPTQALNFKNIPFPRPLEWSSQSN